MAKETGNSKVKDFTLGSLLPELMRSLSKPKTQRRESDSVVKPELNGSIGNSQASAADGNIQ